jgi:hypothetical protein
MDTFSSEIAAEEPDAGHRDAPDLAELGKSSVGCDDDGGSMSM